MSPGKHGPNRFSNYIDTHETIMRQLVDGGFVTSDELTIKALGHVLVIEGNVFINDDVYVSVWKQLSILAGDGADALVQTSAYSYNAVLRGFGNIFRYNSPHIDHNEEHHVHRFDVLGDGSQRIDPIYDEEDVPHLADAIMEAARWYHEHRHELPGA